MRARVVGPDGEPIAGLELWIAGEGLMQDEPVWSLLKKGWRPTDNEGWIERVVGAPGNYHLLSSPTANPWPAWILPNATVEADSETTLEARFVRLRIRAVDRLGNPVEDGDSFCVRAGGELWNWTSETVDGSGTATLEPDAVLAHSATRPWRKTEPHTWISEPGRRYVCGWFSPSRGLVERQVELRSDQRELEVSLELGDRAPRSNLVVQVQSGTIEGSGSHVGVQIESASCGAVLASLDPTQSSTHGREFQIALPAGHYIARIVPQARLYDLGLDPPDIAGAELPIDIGSGVEHRKAIELARGSQLVLHLRAPESASDPRVRQLIGPERSVAYMAAVSGWLPAASWGRVWIRPASQVQFHRLRFILAGVTEPIAGVLPGTSAATFERIAPGRHVLRVECSGFEPIEVEFEAVDGVDVEVAVDLIPLVH